MEHQPKHRFQIKLIVNNKKKAGTIHNSKADAQRAADKIENDRLFWIGNKAYGKVNSYRVTAELAP